MAQHGEGIYLGDTVAKTNQHQVPNSVSEVSECCSAQKMQLWEFRDFILHVCEIPQYQQRFLNSAPSTNAAQGKQWVCKGSSSYLATSALPGLASAGTDHTCVLTPTQGHLQGLLNLGTPFCPWRMHPVYDTGEGHVPQSWESPVLPSQAGLGSDMNLSCSSPVLVPLPRAALEHQQALPEPSLCLGGLARHCHPPETSSLLQTPWVSRGSNPCPAITIRAAQ